MDAFVLAPARVTEFLPFLDVGIRCRGRRCADVGGETLTILSSPLFSLSPKRVRTALSGTTPSLTSQSVPSSTATAAEPSADAAYPGDHATTINNDPMLRVLYDSPRPIDDDDAKYKDDINNHESSNGDWVTHITQGTLPTGDGSRHVLHYEVHHRFRRGGSGQFDLDGKNKNQQRQQTSGRSPAQDFQQTKRKRGSGSGGLTALFLHGGPGAGCFPNHVRFFSPLLYETVVLLDQRGCGRSTPQGRIEENTLELLVEDVEKLRGHLLDESEEIRPWDVILGGSWGCTLALAYAHAYPNHVRAMVLRGICLFRPREIDWLFGDPPSPTSISTKSSNLRSLLEGVGFANRRGSVGVDGEAPFKDAATSSTTTDSAISTTTTASILFPKEWEEFRIGSNIGNFGNDGSSSCEPEKMERREAQQDENRRSILHKYYHLLLGSDPLIRFNATRSWSRWEMGIYSSGFRGSLQFRDNFSTNYGNYSVLVWNPHARYWAYEDARVRGYQSVASISHLNPPSSSSSPRILASTDMKGLPQSLRRYSVCSMKRARMASSLSSTEPIPIRPTATSSGKSLSGSLSTNSGNSTSNSTAVYSMIPAQAMLTCYYSTNDEYCLGRYRSFLSLESPPTSMQLSSWYSSRLPPLMPILSNMPESMPSESSAIAASTTFPLPPTIAIQGANDAICPPDTALDLHEAWNQMELRIVMNGGHSMYDPVVAGEIVKALDRFGIALKGEAV